MATVTAPFALAQYSLVDDFESYSVGSYNAGSTAFVPNGGPWESNIGGGTGLVSIETDGNNYLAFGWSAGVRGANRSAPTIADGGVGTYYFRIRTEDATPDVSYGLSDQPTGALNSFGDFEVQVALTYDAVEGIRLGARNGGTFDASLVTGLSVNTWYDIWVVVDNAADTYSVYYGTSGDPNTLGTMIADGFGFRNGVAANDLVTFMTLSNGHEDNNANLDDIYYSPDTPEPPPLDDLEFGPTSPSDGNLYAPALPVLEAQIIDLASQLDTNSVVLTFDGAVVPHSLVQSGTTSTVSYAVTEVLASWSVHTARVVAASVSANSHTNEWSFRVTGPTLVAVSGPTNFATLATDGAWTWYNDPRAMFHNGKLYFGYVRASNRGKSVLDAFDLSTGMRAHLFDSAFTEYDDHNNPGLCSLEDGRLLAVYSRHITDQYFAYRTSSAANPATVMDWNDELRIPDSGAGMTYANPFQLSAEGGRIYNFCRNQNFNPTVYTSTDSGASWSAPQHFIATGAGGTRPYLKYSSDGVDRIDFLYTDGHPRDVNNSLYHLYYEGGSFYETDGTLVGAYANLPLEHDSGERGAVIYQYSIAAQTNANEWIPSGRAWCWETATDTNGNPVAVFTVQSDNVTGTGWNHDRIYYYYARWTGTEWQKRFIAHAGRPLYSAEDDYAGGICVDPQDPNVIYISSNADEPFDRSLSNTALNANERYELWRGETSDGGLTFNWEAVTTNSPTDNLRPYVPRRNGGEPCVIWFRGTYTTYVNYDCEIVGLFTTDVPVPPPAAPITYVDASSGAPGNTTQWNGASWVTFNPPFNISSTTDNQWEEETGVGWGNGETENWFESNREGTEDCPQLRTMVAGLPLCTYGVFAYFWVANGQGFVLGTALTNNPTGSLPLYTARSGGLTVADEADFTDSVRILGGGDRTLYQVSLGTVTDTNITVYVDDEANGGYDSSCWYDGIGYQLQLAATPTDIAAKVTNTGVTVSWPESHKGWMLQSKASLTDDWMDVTGSTTNTSWEVPGASLQDAEYFRLRYPLP